VKLIRAFVRRDRAEAVVRALDETGVGGISVCHHHGVGHGYDPVTFSLADHDAGRLARVCCIEVGCRDDEVDALLAAIRAGGRTGYRGDGIVFVLPIDRAVRVRTGAEGDGVLRRSTSRGKARDAVRRSNPPTAKVKRR